MRQDGFLIIPGNPAPELAEEIWYDGPGGRRLRMLYAPVLTRFNQPRGAVILCPGRTEFIEKYFEVIRDLQAQGFAVVAFDWPGQGLSQRDTRDALAGHIDDYDTFTEALSLGLAVIGPRLVTPTVLLAHSMGGAIGLEALRTQVIEVEAAAFSAPLWGLKLPPMAAAIIRMLCGVGQSRKPVSAHQLEELFDGNTVTNDEARWKIQRALTEANPTLALGSATWGWVRATLELFRRFETPGALADLTMPILVASGEAESIVDNEAHERIAKQLINAEHLTIPGARHELMMETEERRAMFFKAFEKLLARANI